MSDPKRKVRIGSRTWFKNLSILAQNKLIVKLTQKAYDRAHSAHLRRTAAKLLIFIVAMTLSGCFHVINTKTGDGPNCRTTSVFLIFKSEVCDR